MGETPKIIQNLKPIEKRIYLIYKCPCGARWDFTTEEVNFIGRHICTCGRKLTFAPLKDVRLLLRYDHKLEDVGLNRLDLPTARSYVGVEKPSPVYNETVTSLVKLGFKQSDAKSIVSSLLSQTPNLTTEELVKQVLSGRR